MTMGIILPVLIIEFILLLVALVDCIRAKSTRGPKWLWILLILFISIIGPVLYFVIGRNNR